MFGWSYQETWWCWTVWGLGWLASNGRGWELDTLTLYVGPFRVEFLRETPSVRSSEAR